MSIFSESPNISAGSHFDHTLPSTWIDISPHSLVTQVILILQGSPFTKPSLTLRAHTRWTLNCFFITFYVLFFLTLKDEDHITLIPYPKQANRVSGAWVPSIYWLRHKYNTFWNNWEYSLSILDIEGPLELYDSKLQLTHEKSKVKETWKCFLCI